ncbi:hypothetical protein RMATCC62417_10744 [Rhizopus microsporus]|nr:hypothetical protein RMATCC62417_10744 [Rhizopus microsporus]
MATIGHGPSKSTCSNCYGVSIKTSSSSLVNIQLTGKFAYQGIVMLVKDKDTNRTVGEFKEFDQDLFTSVACDDDDEADQVDLDSNAVIGHIDSKLKQWPVHVGWTMDIVDKPVTTLKFQGMVVIDYDNFHMLPETEFKLKKTVAITTTTSVIETSVEEPTMTISDPVSRTTEIEHTATQTIIEVEHTMDTFVEQERNELFIYTFSILSTLYCSLSVCLRKYIKRRKRRIVDDELQLIPTAKDN